MKRHYFFIITFVIVLIQTIPLISVAIRPSGESPISGESETGEYFTVFLKESDKLSRVGADDYIFGVLAAEMPANYSEEALKAQAVASYTYALYKKNINSSESYDITDDSQTDQAYISRQEALDRWGSSADEYEKKLDSVIDSVRGYVITYESKPILAAYHSLSAGKTESAKNIWGSDFAYLQSVESVGDLLSPEYMSTKKVGQEDFCKKLKDLGVKFSGDADSYVDGLTSTSSGTVLTVTVCGTKVDGGDIRSAFSLPSQCFDISCDDDGFTFTCRGKGHGVGMSQYGANYLAKQGSSFVEILGWYYPSCEMRKSSEL